MADESRIPETGQPLGEQGIFNPKPLAVDKLPVSGTVRAIRLGVFLLMIVAGLLIWLAFRNPFMRPVNRYYKALNKRDPAAMAEAFPDWLVNAQVGGDTMSITDMCAAMVTSTGAGFGGDARASVALRAQKEVGQEYLDRIAAGILTQYQRKVEIKRGLWLTLEITYEADGRELTRTEYARVYRINGKWCLLDVPSESA